MTYKELPEEIDLIVQNALDVYKYEYFKTVYNTLVMIDEEDDFEDMLIEYINTINYTSNIQDDILDMTINYGNNILKEYGVIIDSNDLNLTILSNILLSLKNISIYSDIETPTILNILNTDETDNITKLGEIVDFYTDTTVIEILAIVEDMADNFWKPFITKIEYLIEINDEEYVSKDDTLTMRYLKNVIDDIFEYDDYSKILYSVVTDLLMNDKIDVIANEIYVYFKHTKEYLDKMNRLIFVDDDIYSDLVELDIDKDIVYDITKQIKQKIIHEDKS